MHFYVIYMICRFFWTKIKHEVALECIGMKFGVQKVNGSNSGGMPTRDSKRLCRLFPSVGADSS